MLHLLQTFIFWHMMLRLKRHLVIQKWGVRIGNDVFVGAGTIILPGVDIGNRVIIGAGSVVTKSIPDNSIAVGNPAKVIGSYDEYLNKQKSLMEKVPKFSYNPDKIEQKKIKEFLESNKIGYIE